MQIASWLKRALFAVAFMASCGAALALPEAYRQVEWIQSTGSQWIDTGVEPDATTGIKMDFNLRAYDNVSYLFGVAAGTWGFSLETRNVGFIYYGNWSQLLGYTVGDDYSFELTPGEEGANGSVSLTDCTSGASVTNATALTCSTTGKSLAIFGINGGTKCTRYRLYGMTITKGGEVVRHFVPCVKVYGNVSGLYDTVGGEFYGNSGSGVFGVGPDVVDPTSVAVVSAGYRYAAAGQPSYGVSSGYAVGDGLSFSAPDTVTLGDATVTCAGWKRYNAVTGELVAESTVESRLTCAFDFDVASKIVWQWSAAGSTSATICFDGYQGETPLTNFPALVRLSAGDGSGFSADVCGSADGVRFTLGGDKELPSSCVSWNVDGVSEFWVRVPVLRPGAKIKAEWGPGVVSKRGTLKSVWNDDYVGVYGLDQSMGEVAMDETPNGVFGAASSAPDEVAGVVGLGRLFDGGKKNYFTLGNVQRLPNLYLGSTLECWFKYDTLPSGDRPLVMYYPSYDFYNYGIDAVLDASGNLFARMGYGNGSGGDNYGSPVYGAGTVPAGQWHHAMVTFDADRMLRLYLDGALLGAVKREKPAFPATAFYDHVAYAGGKPSVGNNPRNVTFDGALDEIRLSKVARGADYATAVCMNMTANEVFQSVTPGFTGAGEDVEEPSSYTFSVTAGAGGATSVSGDIAVDAGTTLHLTATPTDATTAFYAWEGDVATQQIFSAAIDLPADRCRAVRAVFGKAYYVRTPEKGGDDSKDGLSPATAKARIAAAVAAINEDVAANCPAVVLVDDGTYPVASADDLVTLGQPIAVRAINPGWKAGVNLMGAGGRRAFKMTSVGAVVDGLAITNACGNGWNNNGLCIDIDAGHVQNCLFGFSRHGAYHCVDVYLRKGWVINSTFTHDVRNASGWGVAGAIWATAGLVESCVFTNNDWQAGVCIAGATELRNCLVANNTTKDASYARGGGVFLGDYANPPSNGGGVGYLVNCTIADNSSVKYGGGVFTPSAGKTFAVNCAFGGNTATEAANGHDFYGPVHLIHSLSVYGSALCGSKVGVPRFTDAENGDYATEGVSPTRDMGTALAWAAEPGAKDLAGNGRVNGKAIDAGCFEFVPGAEEFAINVEASALNGEDCLEVGFSVLVSGAENVSYAWDFGDGETSTAAAPRHTYSQPGYYTVKVVVTDEDSETSPKTSLTFEQEAMIKVSSSVMYVAAEGESTPQPPYATWETAANTLLDAYSLAPSRGILVGAGTIPTGGELNLDMPIFVKGQGPDVTIVNASAGRVNVNRAGAMLCDLTVRSAPAAWNAGNVNTSSGAVVSNCVMESGYSYNSGVVKMTGGRLVDCVLRNFKDVNGCAAGVRIDGGANEIERCVISNCVSDLTGGNHRYGMSVRGVAIAQEGGTLLVRNSLLCGNYASRIEWQGREVWGLGGTVYANAAVLDNCTIVDNVLSNGTVAGVWFYGSACAMTNTIVAQNYTANTNAVGEVLLANDDFGFTEGLAPSVVASLIGGDPKFKAGRDGLKYTIPTSSPCRDAGVKEDWMDGATDLAGNPRRNGRPDIGCYESTARSGMVMTLR